MKIMIGSNGEKMICCICEKDKVRSLFGLYDDRYGYSGQFELMCCQYCGHKFLPSAEFNSEVLTDLYTNYYPRSVFDVAAYKPSQEKHGFMSWLNGDKRSAFRWVPKNVRVLDIGCGFGESLGYHAARGCDVYGVEADENIRQIGRAHV